MKHTTKTAFKAAALVAPLSFCIASIVPLEWDAEMNDVRPARFTLVRGDTVEIAANLFTDGEPYLPDSSDASFLWQTNGMGDAWWTASASVVSNRVSVVWTPAMEPAADSCLAHFRVSSGAGGSYRAWVRLSFQHGPGDSPNALPLPAKVIDFAIVSVTNAPWAFPDEIPGVVSNVVTKSYVESLGISGGGEGGGGIAVETDPQFTEWAFGDGYIEGELTQGGKVKYALTADYADRLYDSNKESIYAADDIIEIAGITTAAATNALSERVEKVALDASLTHLLMVGSNVVMEVTNYNSRVRAPSLSILQLEDNAYKTVWAETNGLSRTLADANAHANAISNFLDNAKADRAWSKHTSGLGADAPDGVTWISTPQTAIAGGYEYAKHVTTHGEVWVLTSNGMGFGGDTNSFFAVHSGDGETLFSIEKTDSILVGVDADGISVNGGVVTIPIGVVSQDPPVCYAANSLVNATWTDLTQAPLPAWVTSATCTGTTGAWVWTITTTAPQAFFQFRVMQEGSTVIRHGAPLDLSRGIIVNGVKFAPVLSGSSPNRVLTWQETL